MGNVLKSWKLFQAWIFFACLVVTAVGNVSFLSWISPRKAWRKMSFIFSLSSVKALHCSLMGLTSRLRPPLPLLEEKKAKSYFFLWLLQLAAGHGLFGEGGGSRAMSLAWRGWTCGTGALVCHSMWDNWQLCVLWHRSCLSVEQGEAVSPSRFFYPLFSIVLMRSPGLLLPALGLGLRSTELRRQGEEEKLS